MPTILSPSAIKKEESLIFSFKKTAALCKTIGICGLEHGCGTTCISLAISNYLCNKKRKKTAYIELNTSGQISSLSGTRESKAFTYTGITFFPQTTLSQLPELLKKDYDYFVLDMGILNPNTAYEFSRCDKQFIVADFCLWKREKCLKKLEQLLHTTNIHQDHVVLLGNPLIKESGFSGKYRISFKVISVPFIKNPFQIASNDFMLYESLLERK